MRIPLVVLLAATLFAQSQPPPPGTRKATQNDKGQPTGKHAIAPDNQGKADPTPAAIDKLTSEIASWKKQQAAAKNENNPSSGGWLKWSTIITALATLAIAGLGLFQWWAMHKQRAAMEQQAQYMRDGLALTKQAADAARDSADAAKRALALSQRPRLAVRALIIDEPCQDDRFISLSAKEEPFKGEGIRGRLSVFNSGNGTATVRDSHCRVLHAGPPELLPMECPYGRDQGGPILQQGQELIAGQAIECCFTGPGPSIDQLQHAQDARISMIQSLHTYVVGWIDYSDNLGLSRRTAFCRHYDRGRGRFSRVRDPDYEQAN